MVAVHNANLRKTQDSLITVRSCLVYNDFIRHVQTQCWIFADALSLFQLAGVNIWIVAQQDAQSSNTDRLRLTN